MFQKLFNKFTQSGYVASVLISRGMARWVLAKLESKQVTECSEIFHRGGASIPEGLKHAGDSFVSAEVIEFVFKKIKEDSKRYGLPLSGLILVLPASYGFLSELTVEVDEADQDIEFQIEGMLASMPISEDDSVAFDWHVKEGVTQTDGLKAISVGAISQSYLERVQVVADALRLNLIGITFEAHCLANMFTRHEKAGDLTGLKVLLIADMGTHEVRLSAFVEGLMVSETAFASGPKGFTTVQAVGALEKLVSAWAKGQEGYRGDQVKLVLCGDMCCQPQLIATAMRSDSLRDMLAPNVAPPGEEEDWYLYQAPCGALRGMPCA